LFWIKLQGSGAGYVILAGHQKRGLDLPYAAVEDLPLPVQLHLPLHAQEIYLGAFNNAWAEYASRGPAGRESTAHRVAWAAVKRKYRKSGERWTLREPD